MREIVASLLAALAFPSYAADMCDHAGRVEEIRLEQLPWRNAFDEKKFSELDHHFNRYLDELDAGRISDAEVKVAFQDFESSEPGREPLHVEWLWARPESRAARLAIGYHYMRRWVDAGAEGDLKAALRAFELAEKQGRKPTLAIAARIRLAGERPGTGLDAVALYRDAIQRYPETLEVRVQAARAVSRQPGGPKQAQIIIDDARQLAAPQRRHVEYFAYHEMAAALEDHYEDREAAAFYDKSTALCRGLDSSLRRSLTVYKRLNQPEVLQARATEYIARRPRDGLGYSMRAWAEQSLGRHAEAFPDYDRAVQRGDGSALLGLGWYFETGTDMPRDRRKALELYTVAAERGVEGGLENAQRLRRLLGVSR